MSNRPSREFAIRTSVGFGGTFLPLAVQLAFLPVWLEATGFEPDAIGLLLGAALAARVVLVPVLVAWSDGFATRRRAFVAFATATALLSMPLLIESSFGIAFAVIAASVGGAAIIPVIDSLALQGVQRHGLRFGRMRLWGSVAFVVATLASGYAIERFGLAPVPLIVIGTLALSLLAGLALPAGGTRRIQTSDRSLAADFDAGLIVGIACGSLVVASHATFYAFASIHWAALGFGSGAIGWLWTIGVLAEIVLFAAVGKRVRLSSTSLLIGGAVAGIVRWTTFSWDGGYGFYVVNSLLHAGTFAAAYLGTQQLIAERVAADRHGRAQALSQVVAGTATAALTVASGWLYARYASGAFIAPALLCGLALVPLCVVYPQSARSGGETIEPE